MARNSVGGSALEQPSDETDTRTTGDSRVAQQLALSGLPEGLLAGFDDPAMHTARSSRAKAARRAAGASPSRESAAAIPLVLTCAACGGTHARQTRRVVREDGTVAYVASVVAHRAQQDSFNIADGGKCFGSDYPGLEDSPQGLVDLFTKKDALAIALAKRREAVLAEDVQGVVDLHGRFVPRGVTVRRTDPLFAAVRRAEVADAETMHAQLQVEIGELRRRLVTWMQTNAGEPLPTPTIRTGYTRLHHDPTRAIVTDVTAAPPSCRAARAKRQAPEARRVGTAK